jgi:hypothetical protein
MFKLISAILSLSVASTVFAASRAELDRQQIKAVADAIIDKKRVAADESIKAIINNGVQFQNDKGVNNSYTIQYVNSAKECSQEGVEAITMLGDSKTEVSFFKMQRQECK